MGKRSSRPRTKGGRGRLTEVLYTELYNGYSRSCRGLSVLCLTVTTYRSRQKQSRVYIPPNGRLGTGHRIL